MYKCKSHRGDCRVSTRKQKAMARSLASVGRKEEEALTEVGSRDRGPLMVALPWPGAPEVLSY